VTHEAGETARSFIDAMRDQPMALALVVMNIVLLGFLYYEGASINSQRVDELKLLYQSRRETSVLLARCKWPDDVPLPKDFQ
jgi:hypothetical protein